MTSSIWPFNDETSTTIPNSSKGISNAPFGLLVSGTPHVSTIPQVSISFPSTTYAISTQSTTLIFSSVSFPSIRFSIPMTPFSFGGGGAATSNIKSGSIPIYGIPYHR